MKLFSRFSSRQVDEFATALAQEVATRFPPQRETDFKHQIKDARLVRLIESIYAKAADYKAREKLGMYKTARLGNTFKWQLKELGYSEQFIDSVTKNLVMHLTMGNKKA